MPLPDYPSPAAGTELPRLLYLPGMDGTGDLFYRQFASLERAFEIRTFSFNRLVTPSWQELVSVAISDHMHDGPVVLCGESFGGCLGLEIAARVPDAVAGLILVNPASSFRRATLLNSISSLLVAIPEAVLHSSSGFCVNWLCNPSRLTPIDRERFKRAIESVSKSDTLHRLELLRQFDIAELPLERFTCPTLVLAGQRDRLLPSESEARQIVARLPSAELKVLPNSGHACLLERNLDLARILQSHPRFDFQLASLANLG